MIDIKLDESVQLEFSPRLSLLLSYSSTPLENRIYFDPWNLPENSARARSTEKREQQDRESGWIFSWHVASL